MNRFIILFFLFFSIKISACSCGPTNMIQDFFESDVTAIIEIKNTFGDKTDLEKMFASRTYKANINFLSLFKGNKFEVLNIVGHTKFVNSGSCEILIEPGEKYLITLNKNEKGEFWISQCSSIQRIYDQNLDETITNYKALFQYLTKNSMKFKNGEFVMYWDQTSEYNPSTKNIESGIKKLSNKKVGFGLYAIKIDDNNSITEIHPIKKLKVKQLKLYQLIKEKFEIYPPENFSKERKYFLAIIF